MRPVSLREEVLDRQGAGCVLRGQGEGGLVESLMLVEGWHGGGEIAAGLWVGKGPWGRGVIVGACGGGGG